MIRAGWSDRRRRWPYVAKKQLQLPLAGAGDGGGAARLVRPRAARPALAGAQGQAQARPLSRSGCPRSCCSRPPSGGHPLLRALPRALADGGGAGGGARSTTCSRPGRGSATTAARAICTSAPASSPRQHGGRFPDTRGRAARAAGHRPLHRRGHRRHRLRRARRRRSTATSSGWWRGCSRSKKPLPAAKAEITPPGRKP